MICTNGRNLGVHITGVQRYTSEIYTSWLDDGKPIRLVKPEHSLHGVIGHLWEQVVLPINLKQKEILWSPSNTGPLLIENQVLTIHDTVPFDHPEWLNKKFAAWYQYIQPKLSKKVSHIITISEFSKERIIHHLKVPEHKVRVVYNGVNVAADRNTIKLDQLSIPFCRYVLAVGSIEPRKNIRRLVEAWLRIKSQLDDDIGLVIVGAQGVSRVFDNVDLSSALTTSGGSIFCTGHVSDLVLHSLYKHASGFCYPSLYEGFGLPPLEAMCYGVPVLTSNCTAMRELCHSSAILIDPLSVESIAGGILELLSDSHDLRVENGLSLTSKLTWKACADKTWSAIVD